jgi:DNA-binding PadR family transcriptional regulator
MNEINRGTLCVLAIYGAQRVRPQYAFDYEVARKDGLVSMDPNVRDAQRYMITDAGRAYLAKTRAADRATIQARFDAAAAAGDGRACDGIKHELTEFDIFGDQAINERLAKRAAGA